MASEKIPMRNEIPEEYTWDLTAIFASDQQWLAEYEALAQIPAELEQRRGTLCSSGEALLDFLRMEDAISLRLEALMGYASCKGDQDLANGYYQDLRGKAMSRCVEISSAAAFATPEIMAIPEETLAGFYRDCPELETYRRSIYKIRRRAEHILSPAEEKLLAAAGEMADSPDNIGSALRNADLRFDDAVDSQGVKHPLSGGTLVPLMESGDRALRESAFHENLEAMYRYVRLRKKALGVEELHMYDVYTPIVSDVAVEIPYEQAREKVIAALGVLGEDYVALLKKGFTERWIDVYENQGKRGGAYSSGISRPHPYVLLNHKDTLDSMFTIAHEMGHALHSYYSCQNQPVNTSDYVIFVAEVASTCNEILLMRALLEQTTDKRQRAYLINHFLDQFKGTIYRQAMFAEFELEMGRLSWQGETLTAELLREKYWALNKLYFGPDMVSDEEIALEWARIPHFFYNYYVFQYATGFSAAAAIAERILTEGEPAVADYKRFLSSGGSADPISLLKIAGVDMASPQPVDAALKLFDQLVGELEALI